MKPLKDPKLYEKNLNHFNVLTYIVKFEGSCGNVSCKICPFSISKTTGWSCYCLIEMQETFSRENPDLYYKHKKMYAEKLLELYTPAEKLTLMIQGEF